MTQTKKPRYAKTAADLETAAQAQTTQEKQTALAAAKRDPTIQALVTQAPRGKTKIGQTPHFEDVIRLFYSGWSCYDIKDYLKNKGIEISTVQLYDYKNRHIQEDQIIKQPTTFQIFQDIVDNEIATLEALKNIQKARVDKLYQAERDTMPGALSDQLSKEIRQLEALETNTARLKQELGLLPKRPQQIDIRKGEYDMDNLIQRVAQASRRRTQADPDQEDGQEADYQDIDIQPAAEP